MEAVRLKKRVRSLATIVLAASLVASGSDIKSWGNLDTIAAGHAVEVRKFTGDPVRGNYAARSEDSVQLIVNQVLVTIPRAQISQIRLRPRTRKALWVSLIVGVGAGAAVGAGVGARFEQSGDFGNATAVASAIFAGVGALVGLAIGSTLADRHAVIYRAK